MLGRPLYLTEGRGTNAALLDDFYWEACGSARKAWAARYLPGAFGGLSRRRDISLEDLDLRGMRAVYWLADV